jgi:hypothetical protein
MAPGPCCLLAANLKLTPLTLTISNNVFNQWVEISCQFLPPGGSMGPRCLLQLFKIKNHKIDKNLTTTKAREKISSYFESFEFLMCVHLNVNTIKLLAEDVDWQPSYLLGERASLDRDDSINSNPVLTFTQGWHESTDCKWSASIELDESNHKSQYNFTKALNFMM